MKRTINITIDQNFDGFKTDAAGFVTVLPDDIKVTGEVVVEIGHLDLDKLETLWVTIKDILNSAVGEGLRANTAIAAHRIGKTCCEDVEQFRSLMHNYVPNLPGDDQIVFVKAALDANRAVGMTEEFTEWACDNAHRVSYVGPQNDPVVYWNGDDA